MRLPSIKSLLIGASVISALYILNDVTGYVSADTFNPYKSTIAYLSRAESSQSSAEVIQYTTAAKQELVKTGHITWWPIEKSEFESIELELEEIIARAENITSLDSQDELFISEMFHIHDRLKLLQQTLGP